MKRWCFSPIVGDGQSIQTAFRVAVADVADTNANAVIPADPFDGGPLYTFAFCHVGTANILGVSQVSNVYLFPLASADHLMSSIGTDPINDTDSSLFALRQACEARGLDTDFWLQHPTKAWGDWTYRDVLLGIVQQHSAAVTNLDLLDVVEPTQ